MLGGRKGSFGSPEKQKKKKSGRPTRRDGAGKSLLERELERIEKNRIEYIKDVL